MRTLILTVALALAAPLAHAQETPGETLNPPPAASSPSSPAPSAPSAPRSVTQPAASKREETVVEHVLYEGTFEDIEQGNARPVCSHSDFGAVMFKRYALMHERPGASFTVTKRVCTYPLNAAGKRLAMGSTCNETEVANG